MKIVRLDIDEDSILAGIDAMALVEAPAIQEDFYYFARERFEETYSDYPEAAVEAAKQGIKRNEEIGNRCATQVGKVRAQQLANREAVSLDTVRRMRAFLIRQRDNYELARDRRDYNACGYISYLLWGGPSALPWTEKILRQAGEEFVKQEYEGLEDACQPGYRAIGLKRKRGRLVPNCVPKDNFSADILEEIIKQELINAGVLDVEDFGLEVAGLPDYSNEVSGSIEVSEASYAFASIDDKQMLVGPAMVPNKLIVRKDEEGNPYYVYFTEDAIKRIAYKMMADKVIDKVNIEHDGEKFVDGAYLVESWIVDDPEKDKSLIYGFKPVKGQWMTMYKIDDTNIWDKYIKSGKVKGFSVEGYFSEKLIK
jgi:ribosomal protein S18 acetylase RimI-like enzyme